MQLIWRERIQYYGVNLLEKLIKYEVRDLRDKISLIRHNGNWHSPRSLQLEWLSAL